MAKQSDKLGYRDFFDDELFTPVIENINALISSLKGLQDTIKAGVVPTLTELRAAIGAFTDAQKSEAEQLRRAVAELSKANSAAKAYKGIQDEVARLEAKLAELKKEEAKRRLSYALR
jgi:hypothetical protein